MILGEGLELFDHQQKSLVLILLNKTIFCLRLHYNAHNSCLFVNGKEIFKFKADNKNVNFPTRFCLGSIYNGFSAHESTEVFSNGIIYDF